jgi:predicted transcriptional regulator of viral defense system
MKLGLPPAALARLVTRGDLEKVGRNLFLHPEAALDPHTIDFAVACELLGPGAAIGGLSALYHYQLMDEAPSRVWVLVAPVRRTRQRRYRLLRTTTPLDIATEAQRHYRIASIERAIVEGFKYERIWGLQTAFGAAKAAIDGHMTTPARMLAVARELALEAVILKHWEALLAFEGPSS